jgi:hypothetical protein
MKMEKQTLWFMVTMGALLAQAGCDSVYPPVLCNGYEFPIHVTAIPNQGNSRIAARLSVGECKKGTVGMVVEVTDSSSKYPVDHITVTDQADKVVGRYSGKDGSALVSGRNYSPHMLLTRNGFFEIPREFETTWRKNIGMIEMSAEAYFPNVYENR